MVIKVLWEQKVAGGPQNCKLRLVVFDEEEPILEKRQFIYEKGREKVGRLRGLRLKDWAAIRDAWPVIHRAWTTYKT